MAKKNLNANKWDIFVLEPNLEKIHNISIYTHDSYEVYEVKTFLN